MSEPDAHVEFLLNGGIIGRVSRGGLIGRSKSAQLVLDHLSISEAHALVSLRDGSLRLLALRGEIKVDGLLVEECILHTGRRIELAADLVLQVHRVVVPVALLVTLNGQPLVVADGSLSVIPSAQAIDGSSVARSCDVVVLQGRHHHACLMLHLEGGVLYVVRENGELEPQASMPATWKFGVTELRVNAMPLPVGTPRTAGSLTRGTRLSIIVRDGAVQFFIGGSPVGYLNGQPAQIVVELVKAGRPVHWELVARKIWGRLPDRILLRANWDKAVGRLRKQLERDSIRQSLVQTDGLGNVELCLGPSDELHNATGK